jgi:hypothetical protein
MNLRTRKFVGSDKYFIKPCLVAIAVLVYLSTANAELYVDSTNIHCTSNLCRSLNEEQLNQIDQIIDNQLSEQNFSGYNSIEDARSVAIISPERLRVDELFVHKKYNYSGVDNSNSKMDTHVSFVVNPEKIDLLGLNKMSNKKTNSLDVERSETLMSFRYSPLKDHQTYFAANIFLEKTPLREDKDYHISMKTVGFGTQVKDGWIVEIGIIKNLNFKPTDKFNPKPDGLLLMLRKKIN